jgi:hypothetical protein
MSGLRPQCTTQRTLDFQNQNGAVLTSEDQIFGPPREARRIPKFAEYARQVNYGLPTRGNSQPSSFGTDRVGRVEFVLLGDLLGKGRCMPCRLSLVFRKCHPLANDLPPRLVVFHGFRAFAGGCESRPVNCLAAESHLSAEVGAATRDRRSVPIAGIEPLLGA